MDQNEEVITVLLTFDDSIVSETITKELGEYIHGYWYKPILWRWGEVRWGAASWGGISHSNTLMNIRLYTVDFGNGNYYD